MIKPKKGKIYIISYTHPEFEDCDYHGIATCNGELDGLRSDEGFVQWYGFNLPKGIGDGRTSFFTETDIVGEYSESPDSTINVPRPNHSKPDPKTATDKEDFDAIKNILAIMMKRF